jgi:hypothetical protein
VTKKFSTLRTPGGVYGTSKNIIFQKDRKYSPHLIELHAITLSGYLEIKNRKEHTKTEAIPL